MQLMSINRTGVVVARQAGEEAVRSYSVELLAIGNVQGARAAALHLFDQRMRVASKMDGREWVLELSEKDNFKFMKNVRERLSVLSGEHVQTAQQIVMHYDDLEAADHLISLAAIKGLDSAGQQLFQIHAREGSEKAHRVKLAVLVLTVRYGNKGLVITEKGPQKTTQVTKPVIKDDAQMYACLKGYHFLNADEISWIMRDFRDNKALVGVALIDWCCVFRGVFCCPKE